MNVRLLQIAGLSLVGLLALTGCPSDDDDADGGGPDAKTNPDATPDSGMPPEDTGVRDMGTPDSGPDLTGMEGYGCTSTLGMNDTMFKQDDCDPGLLCIPWDVVAGRTMDVTAPVHSCVKPCANDGECGAGRFCVPMGFTPESGAGMFCVDEIAGQDQFCGGSRLSVSRLNNNGVPVQYETPGVLVGCPDNVSCAIGFFGDVHPDEGICVNICDDQTDCATSPGTPWCNLIFTSQTSTQSAGICSIGQLGPGALCGDVNNEGTVGLTTRCDAPLAGYEADGAPRNVCAGVQGLFPDGTGFCAVGCDNTLGCDMLSEPGLGNYECTAAPGGTNGAGFCTIPCSNYPEDCEGPGTYDQGRMCYDGLVFNDPNGPVPLLFCMDRLGPPLARSVFTRDAQGLAVTGDNCEDAAVRLGFAKCEDGFTCLNAGQQGVGLCVAGCVRSATVGAGVQGGCEVVSATATCSPALQDAMGNPNPVIGLCGD